MQKRKDKVVVLGLGNLLLGDEGAGIHVINELKKIKLPPNIEIIDGGTSGFKLMAIFSEHKNDRFLIIDAIAAPAVPEIIKNSHRNKHNVTDYNTVKNAEKEENVSKIWGKDEETFPGINNKGDIYVVPLENLYEICSTGYDTMEYISFHQTGLIDILLLLYKTLRIKIKGYLIGINILGPDKSSKTVNLKYSLKLSVVIREKIPDILGIISKYINI